MSVGGWVGGWAEVGGYEWVVKVGMQRPQIQAHGRAHPYLTPKNPNPHLTKVHKHQQAEVEDHQKEEEGSYGGLEACRAAGREAGRGRGSAAPGLH